MPASVKPGRSRYRGWRDDPDVDAAGAGGVFRARPGAGASRPATAAQSRANARSASRLPEASTARDALLALGLVLSPASRLRFHGSPIGPGEFCLLIWLLLMLFREAARPRGRLTPALLRLLVFWALFAVALSIGTITGYAIQDSHDPIWFRHDLFAYPLLATVSCFSALESDLNRVAWFLVVVGTGCLALQLADAWGLFGAPGIESWYWFRLRGWSENPAQLAFLCAALGLLTLHLAETANRPAQRAAAIACSIMPLIVGFLTRTDTFTLVIVAAGALFVILTFRAWLLLPERNLTFRTATAWIAILAVPPVLGCAALLAPSVVAQTSALARNMSKDDPKVMDQEAQLRFDLWGEAWNRGLQSGMLGLGPGPHLPIPSVLVESRQTEAGQPQDDPHPQANEMPNFEAHDTVLDLFTQGGLLADLSYLWLAATALVSAYKARLMGLATLLGGLLLFGGFDLTIRYPIFWYAISLCLVASFGARNAAPAQNRR